MSRFDLKDAGGKPDRPPARSTGGRVPHARAVFSIAERPIGADAPVYVIAEIGSNHDGELERALGLVEAAAAAGADAVKFQSFTADGLSRRGEAAHPVLEKLALPDAWIAPLRACAAERGLHFLSTPFDEGAASTLAGHDLPAFKIASGDLTHAPLLDHVAAFGRPVLLSTGLSDLEEVEAAVARIGDRVPLALLHCVASYPPSPDDWNLRAVATLAAHFGCVVGLSDHSAGHAAVCGAVALGARVVEKHLSDDPSRPGPDHAYALSTSDFAAMVSAVRDLERGLGDGLKRCAPSERGGLVGGRRSLHAARAIAAGERLDASMVKVVRPADGLPPDALAAVVVRRARRALLPDTPIVEEHLA